MKHLLSVTNLDVNQAVSVLNLAVEMQGVNSRDVKKIPALTGRTVANLFFEDSTRTRMSFELAAKRLSADIVNFSAKGSSLSKGESLRDTIQTLEAMGVDALVIRHSSSGVVDTVAKASWSSAVVINAGDGTHEHPTQALLDALTIRQRTAGREFKGNLEGQNVLIVGDILHSRVARSNIKLLTMLGARVSICAPATLQPLSKPLEVDQVFLNFDEALTNNFSAVMMLRLQAERMASSFFPNLNDYVVGWGLTEQRFKKMPKDTLIMHPGPMVRGLEICSAAADSMQSTVLDQVANGVAVRMAVLYQLLAKDINHGA